MASLKAASISRSATKAGAPKGRSASANAGAGWLTGLPPLDEVAAHHLMDGGRLVAGLAERAVFTADERARASDVARRIVVGARAQSGKLAGIDAFLKEYGLSSEEGVILLCLAESLLRIPDRETADQLIAEKIADGHWDRHLGHSTALGSMPRRGG
jgi:RHH-type transcriptional regulator, proline utilization regulon repressor / proline dehydrogenase / delta 1-pyrroline-5-carboxylate dehydrogenase